MELNTRVTIPTPMFGLSYNDRILMIGSCFTENIGQKLIDNKFTVDVNPFGPLYNSTSVVNALHLLLTGKLFDANDLFKHEGIYHSLFHHSRFSSSSAESCLRNINERLVYSGVFLKQATVLIVTLGTSSVYYKDGQAVANCHKLPAGMFTRKRMWVEAHQAAWNEAISELRKVNPHLRIIFTVSPIRHFKDGAHENQISKSAQLLGIEKVMEDNRNQVEYFPAYEIMMDELRDYRFYADDMLHPSAPAIDYIWERFTETYLDKGTLETVAQWTKIRKDINHKPFNPESERYRAFVSQTLLKIERIKQKFPNFDVLNETEILKSKQS